MKKHFRKLSFALVIALNLNFSILLPNEISKAMQVGSILNDDKPHIYDDNEPYIYSATLNRNIPVKDVSDRVSGISKATRVSPEEDRAFRRMKEQHVLSNPNLSDEQKERAIKWIKGNSKDRGTRDETDPAPDGGGGNGGGDIFTPAFQYRFSDRTVLEYTILCPTKAGGSNPYLLYLTSTTRATLGMEALVAYYGQDDFSFRVFDWARGEANGWQVYMPYYTLSNYLTTITVNGINYQALTIYNSTKIIGVVDPAYQWKNAVFLYNYSTGYYDSIYHYAYPASIAAQKTGAMNWGPIFEGFLPAQYSNLNPMGFYECVMFSNSDNYGDLRLYPSRAQFNALQYGLQLLYLESNYTFTAH